MDIIYLEELRIETTIGIFDWERAIKQPVNIYLEMATNIQAPAATDEIKDALDYKAVAKRLLDFVGQSEFQLLETLAESIAAMILEEFNTPWIKLKLSKLGAIRGAKDVGIIIERGQQK